MELGFEDLRLGFGNLVLGFKDGGLGFEVLPKEQGVLSREAGWLGGVKAPGARFAFLGGCSRTRGGNTCRWDMVFYSLAACSSHASTGCPPPCGTPWKIYMRNAPAWNCMLLSCPR